MIEPLWHQPLKIVLVTLAIAGGYAWVSADDWELEIKEEQERIELAQRLKPVPPAEPDFEPDWSQVQPIPVAPNPLAQARKTAKKAAVKTKKRVKKAFKPKQ